MMKSTTDFRLRTGRSKHNPACKQCESEVARFRRHNLSYGKTIVRPEMDIPIQRTRPTRQRRLDEMKPSKRRRIDRADDDSDASYNSDSESSSSPSDSEVSESNSEDNFAQDESPSDDEILYCSRVPLETRPSATDMKSASCISDDDGECDTKHSDSHVERQPRGLMKFSGDALINAIAKIHTLAIDELMYVFQDELTSRAMAHDWKAIVARLYTLQNPDMLEPNRGLLFDYSQAARDFTGNAALDMTKFIHWDELPK
jgi:hypothetical protein